MEFIQKNVNKKRKELTKLFANWDEEKKRILNPIIEEMAFLIVAIEECKKDMLENGLKTTTVNASQQFCKANPSTKIYSDYLKAFKDNIKLLLDYAPTEKEEDELAEFMKNLE